MASLVRLGGTRLFRFAPEIRIDFLGSPGAKKPLRRLKGYIAPLINRRSGAYGQVLIRGVRTPLKTPRYGLSWQGKRSTVLERFPVPLSITRLVQLSRTRLFRFAPEIRIYFLGRPGTGKRSQFIEHFPVPLSNRRSGAYFQIITTGRLGTGKRSQFIERLPVPLSNRRSGAYGQSLRPTHHPLSERKRNLNGRKDPPLCSPKPPPHPPCPRFVRTWHPLVAGTLCLIYH